MTYDSELKQYETDLREWKKACELLKEKRNKAAEYKNNVASIR